MAENRGPALQLTRCRLPTSGESTIEQFISARAMVPHGDRFDRTESSSIEDKALRRPSLKDHIVSVFVLRNRLERDQFRLTSSCLSQRLIQRFQSFRFGQ